MGLRRKKMAGKDDWESSHDLDALHIVFIFLVRLDGKERSYVIIPWRFGKLFFFFFIWNRKKASYIAMLSASLPLRYHIDNYRGISYPVQRNAIPNAPLRQQNQINQCIQSLLVPVELVPPLFQSGLLASRILV